MTWKPVCLQTLNIAAIYSRQKILLKGPAEVKSNDNWFDERQEDRGYTALNEEATVYGIFLIVWDYMGTLGWILDRAASRHEA